MGNGTAAVVALYALSDKMGLDTAEAQPIMRQPDCDRAEARHVVLQARNAGRLSHSGCCSQNAQGSRWRGARCHDPQPQENLE